MTRMDVKPEELEAALRIVRSGRGPAVALGSWRELREALDREVITRDEARAVLGLAPYPESWFWRLWHTIAPAPATRVTTTSRGSAS